MGGGEGSFPGGTNGKESTCQCRRCAFNPWVRKIPLLDHGNLIQYSSLENPHGQRNLVGSSLEGCKESDVTEATWHFLLSFFFFLIITVQFSRSAVSDSLQPMDWSTPGLPVHHQLPEFTQTHVHWVSNAIQPFHPLSSPSPPALNLSQHQGLFQWAGSLHQVAKVLELQF